MTIERLIPRTPDEIYGMLAMLDDERERLIQKNMLGAALAIGSQIQMLKWAYNLENKK